MATWVNLRKVAKFPAVEKVYSKAGRGQGNLINSSQGSPPNNIPGSAAKGFLRTVQDFIQGKNPSGGTVGAGAAWIRKAPGASNDWQDVQIDVEAIPGIRKLRKDGTWANFP